MTLTDEIKPTVICHEVGWAEESIWPELWYRHCFRDGKCVDCDTPDRRQKPRDVPTKPQNIDTKDECVDTIDKKVTAEDVRRIGGLNYRKGLWETRGGLFD